jgi:cytochrome c oxidase cbb3-type subunit 3
MDDKWIYGSEPRSIYASILEGRPNGMPSFRGKIPDAQVWQLVAYIRSMSGKVPAFASPGRDDAMSTKEPETMAPKEKPKGGAPPSTPGSTTQ